MNSFREKALRTDVGTYERTDRSQRPVGRETKNQTILMKQSEESGKNLIFKPF